jgi:hypothetical protein
MAFTRFHDDPCRIVKQLQESTDPGVYRLNVPGNGANMSYFSDPSLRLQFWGANRHNELVALEGELRGIGNRLTCNTPANAPVPRPNTYSSDESEVTAQPRATMPAWELRGVDHVRWDPVLGAPQAHALSPIQGAEWTRKHKIER